VAFFKSLRPPQNKESTMMLLNVLLAPIRFAFALIATVVVIAISLVGLSLITIGLLLYWIIMGPVKLVKWAINKSRGIEDEHVPGPSVSENVQSKIEDWAEKFNARHGHAN
jgi:hypothetical protein